MNKRRLLMVVAMMLILAAVVCTTAKITINDRTTSTPKLTPATPPATRTHTQGVVPPPLPLPATRTHGSIGVSDNLGHLPTKVLHARLNLLKAAGVQWLRKDIEWSGAEPTPGTYRWVVNDPTVAAAQRYGIRPVLILGYAPEWAAGAGQGDCRNIRCSPANTPQAVAAFGAFAGAAARHYCAAPFNVRAFEIWNEPNLHKYWPQPNPELYVRFLHAASTAIRATGCKATILLGGLGDSTCTPCMSSADFLRDVYAAGGRPAFDHVSNHPYIQGVPNPATWRPAVLHRIMAAHGDSHKQVWVTEFAYSSNSGVDQQAQLMRVAIATFQSYRWSGPLFWFGLQDTPGSEKFGLVDQAGRPKPALGVLGTLARRG